MMTSANTEMGLIENNILTTSCSMPKPTLPCEDLLGNTEDYFSICVPLYEASITGDWEAAKAIFDKRPELVRFAITDNCDIALHVAASAKEINLTKCFVENLVDLMTNRDLELQNKNGSTAFYSAAAAGNAKMCKIMSYRNVNLLDIPANNGTMPLSISASNGKYSTMQYLYDKSKKMSGDYWTDENRRWVLLKCVECDFFDVAVKIVTDCPELAMNEDLLRVLARKPEVFNRVEEKLVTKIIQPIYRFIHMDIGAAGEDDDTEALRLLRIIWNCTIRGKKNSTVDGTLRRHSDTSRDLTAKNFFSQILFVAAKVGNTRFVVEILRAYPDLIWQTNEDNLTIFHKAVKHRQQDIYNMLYEIGSMKDLITPLVDEDDNNMLHLVGMTSKKMRSQTSGASLILQRELLWFKEVEKMLPPGLRKWKNKDGLRPYEVFSKENQDLVSKGLDWMKDCMVVATLIVTVTFAVAFTVPGGYNQETGIPIFVHGNSFLVFVIANAISLFSSSTSLLVFLSILTSRHGQRDFMSSLPNKLMIGLVTLFISVAAMMVTFSASFFVIYHKGLKWVPLLIATFATVPVFIFALLQFPLLVDMFRSMYDSCYLFKPKKRLLYHTNPRF